MPKRFLSPLAQKMILHLLKWFEDFAAKPIEEIEELFHQKQYQIVIEECERLIAYDPARWESNWARLKLSECYTALGQPEKAQAILAEAEMSHPEE